MRDVLSGEIHFRIPKTFLSYNPRRPEEITMQARFMAWNTPNHISLIDVNAEPHIQEIIQIPEEPYAGDQLSYEVTSASIPFLDIEPYSKMCQKNPSERRLGSGNFFKGKLAFANSDKKSRLRRIHQALKRIWYLNVDRDKCIENQKK